jgi:ATP-binding cassette subfamily C (CFTR/MRP) protein 1
MREYRQSKIARAHTSPPFSRQVGYSRPLEIDDIWNLPPDQSASFLGDAIERHYFSRVPPSRRPRHLRRSLSSSVGSEVTPALLHDSGSKEDQLEFGLAEKTVVEPIEPRRRRLQPISEREDKGRIGKLKAGDDSRAEEGGKVYDQSLLWALNQLVFWK